MVYAGLVGCPIAPIRCLVFRPGPAPCATVILKLRALPEMPPAPPVPAGEPRNLRRDHQHGRTDERSGHISITSRLGRGGFQASKKQSGGTRRHQSRTIHLGTAARILRQLWTIMRSALKPGSHTSSGRTRLGPTQPATTEAVVATPLYPINAAVTIQTRVGATLVDSSSTAHRVPRPSVIHGDAARFCREAGIPDSEIQ